MDIPGSSVLEREIYQKSVYKVINILIQPGFLVNKRLILGGEIP